MNLSCHSQPIRTALAATAFFMTQAAGAAEIAPYFHTWDGPLMNAKQDAGMNSALLAFAITRGNCALEPTLPNMLPDARNFIAAGGKLMISFGGTAGVYVETACTNDDELFAVMEKLMLDSGFRRFEFDIEGYHTQDTDSTARRARVLARLQAKYPDLAICISLPGWLNGFSAAGIELLKTTLAAGVRIDTVNVMAQSFGIDNVRNMLSPPTMAQAVITTFRAASAQVAPLFPNKNPAQLNAMLGVSPMIGTNDDGSTFTLGDAQTVADFVKQNGIGLLSWWSFQRDRLQTSNGYSDLNKFSGVAQSDFQFHTIFKSAEGPVAGAPASAPAAASACSAPGWDANVGYMPGDTVSRNGLMYAATTVSASGWNVNSPPEWTPTYWSLTSCGG
jgi:roadblock/LC7 domain-containing protein